MINSLEGMQRAAATLQQAEAEADTPPLGDWGRAASNHPPFKGLLHFVQACVAGVASVGNVGCFRAPGDIRQACA